MDETLEIELHLQCTVPVLKSKHRAPVQPERRIEYLVVEHILDRLVVEILILCHEQLHDLHAALLAQIELAVCVRILAALLCGTAQGIVRVFLVQPVILVQNGDARRLNRRNAAEQIPQTLKMVLHLTSAAHHISSGRIIDTVAGASCNVHRLKNVNVGTFHLTVSHQEAGCCQRGQSAADNIGTLLIHTLRLSRSRKSLVITVGIVDTLAVLLMPAALGIAVFRSRLLLDRFLLRTLAVVLMADDDAPFPAAIFPLAHHAVTGCQRSHAKSYMFSFSHRNYHLSSYAVNSLCPYLSLPR